MLVILLFSVYYQYQFHKQLNNEGQMKVEDGRGKNSTEAAKKNKESVREWFNKNPHSTITACCKGLNLTYKPVRKYIDLIQEEEKEA